MEKKINKIPIITEGRLNSSENLKNNNLVREEPAVKAFLKGKEPIQAITLRFPQSLYKLLRKVAFNKEEKINKIIVRIVHDYLKDEEKKN